MKKNIFLFACIALFFIAFTACSNYGSSKAAADSTASTAATKDTAMQKQTATVYTCKMHPEVISDKPGKCPKCGMDLVKKEDLKKDNTMRDMKMDSTKH